MAENPTDVIKRYLEDAIAAEKNFEDSLRAMSKEVSDPEVSRMYLQHADETRVQYERLTARLTDLGGSPSTLKSFLAHFFGMAPKSAQMGHEAEEKTTQDLMIAYSVENAEVAMYESLITVAEAAGDTATASLAREIQQQEQATAEKIWPHIARTARIAFDRVCAVDAKR